MRCVLVSENDGKTTLPNGKPSREDMADHHAIKWGFHKDSQGPT